MRKSLWNKFWKFQVTETNFGSVFLVKFLYMHQIFDVWNFIVINKALPTIFIWTIKNKTFKNFSKIFYRKSSFCLLQIMKFLYLTLPLFLFLGYCWFYTRNCLMMMNSKIYYIIMFLNWILNYIFFNI